MDVFDVMAKVAMPVLAATSYYCTWDMSERNGFLDQLRNFGNMDPIFLPLTDAVLRRDYTGVASLDQLLTSLTLTFWPAVDGSAPTLSLFAFHFAGQLVPLCVILMLEARRLGNKWRLISFITVWCLLGQAAGFTNVMPIYCLLHLFTSPTTRTPSLTSPNTPSTNLLISPTDLFVLPISLTFGFVLPTILIALPSPTFSSFDDHQILMAIWQGFPAVVAILQFVLSNLLSVFLPFQPRYRSAAERNARTLQALRLVYVFAFAVSAVTHVAALTLSISSVVLPNIFSSDIASFFHPNLVFLPPLANPLVSVESVGDGILYFLHYDQYLGFASAIIWVVALNWHARSERASLATWLGLFTKVIGLILVAGPGSAAIALMWERDEAVLGEYGGIEENKMF